MRSARRSSSPTATGITSARSRTSPRAPPRRCTRPRQSGTCSSAQRLTPTGSHLAAQPEQLLTGGESIEVAGIVFETSASPATRRVTSPTRQTVACSPATSSSPAGRANRPPGRRLGRRSSSRSGRSSSASRPRPSSTRGMASRRRSGRARDNPFLAELPRVRDVRGAARNARHPSGRATVAGSTSARDREAVRPYGYGRITTPMFEDTELFARTRGKAPTSSRRRCTRSRTGRPLAHAPPGGDAPARPRVRRARAPPRAAAGQARTHRADVPLRAAPEGPLPELWQVGVEAIGSADPAVDAELIELYAELLGSLGVARVSLELNSIGDRDCRPAYVSGLEAWLDRTSDRADARHARSAGRARCGCSTARTMRVQAAARRRAARSASPL